MLASENAAGGSSGPAAAAVMFAASVCRLRVDASFHRNQPSSAEKKRLCAADALLLSVVLMPATHAPARTDTHTVFMAAITLAGLNISIRESEGMTRTCLSRQRRLQLPSRVDFMPNLAGNIQ